MVEPTPFPREWMGPERGAPLSGGDGGGTYDGMETRVKALEGKFEKVDSKLDTIINEVGNLRADVSYMKGKLETAPSAQAFGELKGRVDSLPTMAKLATLLGVAVAATTILNNWDKIISALSGS